MSLNLQMEAPDQDDENATAPRTQGHNQSDSVCVFVTPVAMEAMRNRPMSQSRTVQGHSNLRGTLPKSVYESLFVGRQRKPLHLTEVIPYVKQLQYEIAKYKKKYKVRIFKRNTQM